MHHETQTIFVVVDVQAGIAVSAECFTTTGAAERRAEELRLVCAENEDDIQVFEASVDALK
jgi:hypothetical protein